jgi:CRISPR-associated protein Csx17
MHIHTLAGCAPAPLAHYLKALGILRVVAGQADPLARGWWEGDRFRLACSLDADALASFFLASYAPAPLVSPWNRGSGFYKAGDPGITPLANSTALRFGPCRAGIDAARRLLGAIETADQAVRAIKQETKLPGLSKAQREALRQSADYKARLAAAERHFKSLKADLLQAARAAWRGPHLQWMNAAVVIGDLGDARFPALLGTGGSAGNLDFTNNFMQRVNEVFDVEGAEGGPRPPAANWLSGALWGTPSPSCLSDRAVGQYLPGMAGGANSANGADGESLLNPFDFLFMMEGSLVFAATAVRRLEQKGPSRAAAPFVVSSHAAGYASASPADETARGEQWMPLWSQPMTLPETQRLFAEGRAQLGASPARDAMDLASAAANLGVSRGVVAFQRFGYIERNGQSNLAVPLGQFVVREQPAPVLACLEDIGPWLKRLRRQARDKGATVQLAAVERELARNTLELLQHPGEPTRWQALLESLAGAEAVMRTGTGFKAQPVPPLRPEWVTAADDGSPEFRLALSFALQAADFQRSNGKPIDGIRRHWLPLDRKRPGCFATTGDLTHQRLAMDSGVVVHGRDGVADAIALLERRLVDAAQQGQRTLPLRAAARAWAHPADLAAWVAGQVDTDRTLALARALMALDRGLWAEQIVPVARPADAFAVPDDAFLVLRLAHLNVAMPDGRRIPCDAAILRRLASGDAATAVALALRRLRSAGLRCTVQAAAAPAHTARLWAAALAFPIHPRTAQAFARRLDPTFAEETPA